MADYNIARTCIPILRVHGPVFSAGSEIASWPGNSLFHPTALFA